MEAVGRADERRALQAGMREPDAQPDERSLPAEGVAEQGEQGCALLERLEQGTVGRKVFTARFAEKMRRPPTPRCLGAGRSDESRAQQLEEGPLPLGKAALGEGLAEPVGAERQPCRSLVQVLRGPADEPSRSAR